MKIAYSIITFNSDFVLRQCIENIYDSATQILISEGPVTYWANKGYTTSTDRTNEIIEEFPDFKKKIKIVRDGPYGEKDNQAMALNPYIRDDIDYLFNVDSDEFINQEDLKVIIDLLEKGKYTSVSFESKSFYGGFSHVLTGFESNAEFTRVFKVYPGSGWASHRPPNVDHVATEQWPYRSLNFKDLADQYGIYMYHYSYVFPRQVKEKIAYYKGSINKNNCIDNYFEEVYLKWVFGCPEEKAHIENKYNGVHEWKKRGACRTTPFTGNHPKVIERDLPMLKAEFDRQLKEYI